MDGGFKCRAAALKVLAIFDKAGKSIKKANGKHDPSIVYEVGKIVKPDSYDPDPLISCSNGLHFFVSRREAEAYLR